MATFSERLFELRRQRDLTQLDLANYIGLNKQTISQYERGVRRPDIETLSALCDYFNVSTDYILGKSDVTLRLVDSAGLSKLDSAFVLSEFEKDLISAYRQAPESRREAVRTLLEIEK